MAIHKGTELNNVNETWNENEKRREQGEDRGAASMVDRDLQKTIQDEAAEYDRANKEDRLLDGERATLNDDNNGGTE